MSGKDAFEDFIENELELEGFAYDFKSFSRSRAIDWLRSNGFSLVDSIDPGELSDIGEMYGRSDVMDVDKFPGGSVEKRRYVAVIVPFDDCVSWCGQWNITLKTLSRAFDIGMDSLAKEFAG